MMLASSPLSKLVAQSPRALRECAHGRPVEENIVRNMGGKGVNREYRQRQ